MHLIVKDNPMGEFHRSCICQSAREWWNGALSLYQINTYELTAPVRNVIFPLP